MLWDLIRDFFVMYVFGGSASDNVKYSAFSFGKVYNSTDGSWDTLASDVSFELKGFIDAQDGSTGLYYSVSDWLSTTATIISISIIVVLCCLFVYKIIKLIGGLIR